MLLYRPGFGIDVLSLKTAMEQCARVWFLVLIRASYSWGEGAMGRLRCGDGGLGWRELGPVPEALREREASKAELSGSFVGVGDLLTPMVA